MRTLTHVHDDDVILTDDDLFDLQHAGKEKKKGVLTPLKEYLDDTMLSEDDIRALQSLKKESRSKLTNINDFIKRRKNCEI
jgi:hypothetical protein